MAAVHKIVDGSHYHPVTSVAALAGSDVVGFIGKVSEGAGGADVTWRANRDLSIRAGKHVGPYHFWRYAASPQQNVDAFMRQLGDYSLCTIRAALDCEDTRAPKEDQAAVADHIARTLELLRVQLGDEPMIYTGDWWWGPWVGGHGGFAAALAIWLSGYTANEPTAVAPWNRKPDLWQDSDAAAVPGVAGLADLSVCDDAGLAKITRGAQPSPTIYTPGDEPLSAAEVAEINAHTDEAANGIVAYLTKVIDGEPGDSAPGVAAMVASMHHGNYGETAGAAQGDLSFMDRHVRAAVRAELEAAGLIKPTQAG